MARKPMKILLSFDDIIVNNVIYIYNNLFIWNLVWNYQLYIFNYKIIIKFYIW